MDRTSLHLEIRNALSLADELGRHEHARGDEVLAAHLSSFRTSLEQLEREVGRSHETQERPEPETVSAVERSLESLLIRRDTVPHALRRRFDVLFASAERVSLALWDPSARVPAKPVLGVLPLARAIPQDVHSVGDYVSAAACVASAKLARTAAGRVVGSMLGTSVAGVSALTDYRLSVAKVVPIETHEKIDFAWGAAAVCAPFVFGYAKKDPVASALQIVAGLGTIVTSLFTDYRAERGVTRPTRSRGGPDAHPMPPSIDLQPYDESGAPEAQAEDETAPGGVEPMRVPEVQRPLEGLSSAPSDWRPDDERFLTEGHVAPPSLR